jgi:hypothetical protein
LAYSYASIWRRNNIDDLLYDQPDNGRADHEIVSQIPHSKLSPSWEMTRMLLLKIKELVESDGAKFGILHVPVKEHFYKRLSGAPSKGEFFNVLSSIVKQESIVMFDPYNDMFSFAKKIGIRNSFSVGMTTGLHWGMLLLDNHCLPSFRQLG